jgi:hypothetical protein
LQYRIGVFPIFSFPISATHTFFRGTTPVIVIASNSCGVTARIFLVTVNDNEAPSITCKPSVTKSANGSGRYSVHGHEFDATASDGCGVSSLIYQLSGATVDNYDNNNRSLSNVRLNTGVTTITWKATDVNGNVSTCSTVVTVVNNNAQSPESQSVVARQDEQQGSLKVRIAPNPSSNYFTLSFQSPVKEKIKMHIVDVSGREKESMSEIWPNSTMQVGHQYRPGVYFAEIIQGKDRIVVKLIKEGN